MSNTVFPLHIRTLSGLEKELVAELRAFGVLNAQAGIRSVTCETSEELLYTINLWSRVATRVLIPITKFSAPNEEAFYKGIQTIDWSTWLRPTGTLAIETNCFSSFSSHSLYLSQLGKDAIADFFREKTGERPSVDLSNPDLRIVVNLANDEAQVMLDSSGDSLHKRGYRQKTGEAPLSETLAAGLVKLSQWDRKRPLLDPMCGSGTILIEAALMLKNIAPGLYRPKFGFQSWLTYNASLFQRLVKEARKAMQEDQKAKLIGLEIDPRVAKIARENLAAAEVEDVIEIVDADFFSWETTLLEPGTLIANPPYDERLPVDNTALLLQRMGDRFKQTYSGWDAFLLSGNIEATKFVGLRPSERWTLYNGPIECKFLHYPMVAVGKALREEGWREKTFRDNSKWKDKIDIFENRLKKNERKFSNWLKQQNISCYRVYDWDIPELPFLIDVYEDKMHFAEVVRNHDRTPIEHHYYLEQMMETAQNVLRIKKENTYFKKRKPQRAGEFQYETHDDVKEFIEVKEGGHRFLLNLSDYLDVGLFLDHRKTRKLVQEQASGKDFLNLFGYTGAFTVYAARGGAKSTVTVDTSKTYLAWAQENLELNDISGEHELVRGDSMEYLRRTNRQFDLCVVDPPSKSVNRSSERDFHVQEDQVELLSLVLKRMRPKGKIFFSTNYKTFELESVRLTSAFPGIQIREITQLTTSFDFEKRPNHHCWEISL